MIYILCKKELKYKHKILKNMPTIIKKNRLNMHIFIYLDIVIILHLYNSPFTFTPLIRIPLPLCSTLNQCLIQPIKHILVSYFVVLYLFDVQFSKDKSLCKTNTCVVSKIYRWEFNCKMQIIHWGNVSNCKSVQIRSLL